MNDSALLGGRTTSTFRHRVLRASLWTFGGHVATQLLRLISNLIMTRLLLPHVFGVMSIVNVLLTGLNLVSDLGLGQGVIQNRRGADAAYLNTAWTVQILRGALIWVGALLIAAALALLDHYSLLPPSTAYSDPRLPALVAGISINGLLGGLISTKVASANRNLALGRLVQIDIYSQSVAIVVMVIWAHFNATAWALVAGAIISSITRLGLSHAILPGESNRLHWDRAAFREIFGFGKWIFLTSILGFLAANGDRVILGGLIDASSLGVYVIAAFMITATLQIFSKITNNVAFPALSEVARERPDKLCQTYYKFRVPLDVSSLFATGFLFSAGAAVVRVLYNSRYQQAGHMLEILSISLFEVRYSLVGTCMMALGKPRLLGPVLAVQLIALLAIPAAFHAYGLDAALWVISGSYICTIPVTFYMKVTHGLMNLRRELVFLPCVPAGYAIGLGFDKLTHLIILAR